MFNYLQSYINSGYFNQLYQFSGTSLIINFLQEDKYLNFLIYLSRATVYESSIGSILERIKEIENIKIDERYSNPYDIELTVLAWFLYQINDDYKETYDISNIKNADMFYSIIRKLSKENEIMPTM